MTQIEYILEKISRLQEVNESLIDRLNKLEDDMQFRNEKTGSGFEDINDDAIWKAQVKASMMVAQNANMLVNLYRLDNDTAVKVGTTMAEREVEWNMAATEGADYDYWCKVYEKLQSKS